MIHSETLSSFKICIEKIETEFDVDLSKPQGKVLLRGENDLFATTQPSVKRLLDEYKMKFRLVSPFIDFEEIYTKFYAEKHDLPETEALGFLQHYGFPTGLLDLTPSVKTTHFFSHLGNEDKKVGYIGVFDVASTSRWYEIVNLSNDPYALRPQRQQA